MENPFEIINSRLERIEKILEKIALNYEATEDKYPELLNVKQVAEYLQYAVPTIYQLTRLRAIPHSKNGNRLFFDKDTVRKWALEKKVLTVEE